MDLKSELQKLYKQLQSEKRHQFSRKVSFGDLISEREEIATAYGFGKDSTCYDNVLILGDVRVGENTWIGPNVILDGSGGLIIGDYCSISAGAQIYTHNTVKWSTSMGEAEVEEASTTIGNGVYIGPNCIVQMGVKIGNRAVVGANSLVNSDIPDDVEAWGTPARVV